MIQPTESISQITGIWHSSYFDVPFTDYCMQFNGDIKSWTMTRYDGVIRTLTFDANRNIETDTCIRPMQTTTPRMVHTIASTLLPKFVVFKSKNDFEKKHVIPRKKERHRTYNKQMQLVKHKAPNYLEKNTFNDSGDIIIHKEIRTTTETRAWNSIHHESPTYTFTLKTSQLILYRYNDKGSLTEVEYFHSTPSKNIKMVYIYNDSNLLIEVNKYDSYNISVQNMPSNYLDDILKKRINTTFSIDDFFDNYWEVGRPKISNWKYNNQGQKIEYSSDFQGETYLRVEWEYDEFGHVQKETQYDVKWNRVRTIIDFDQNGNVIKQTDFVFDGNKDRVTNMKISYDQNH